MRLSDAARASRQGRTCGSDEWSSARHSSQFAYVCALMELTQSSSQRLSTLYTGTTMDRSGRSTQTPTRPEPRLNRFNIPLVMRRLRNRRQETPTHFLHERTRVPDFRNLLHQARGPVRKQRGSRQIKRNKHLILKRRQPQGNSIEGRLEHNPETAFIVFRKHSGATHVNTWIPINRENPPLLPEERFTTTSSCECMFATQPTTVTMSPCLFMESTP